MSALKLFMGWCLAVFLAVAITACDGGGGGDDDPVKPRPQPVAVDPMQASWEIGPITPRHGNYSVGMPPTMLRGNGGLYFDFPQPDASAGHVHYVTFRHGPLTGKSRIVMRYRIEAAEGVQFYPTKFPGSPSIITLYFQRRGDEWGGEEYEAYRWWATFTSLPLTPGEHEIVADLSGNWTAVQTSSATSNPRAFREAVVDADRVGFTLGGGDGYGHGVYATGPARMVVTAFQVQ
jgi:hypothetical protein